MTSTLIYSVVIPTHLRSELLETTLGSVTAQSHPPGEIIVVSDVPDPVAEETCARVGAGNAIDVRYVFDPTTTGGASASRNIGAQQARGDAIAFLDDDDRWLPDYLHEVNAEFERSAGEMIVTWRSLVRGDVRVDGPPMKRGLRAKDVVAASLGTTGSNIVVLKEPFWRCGGFDPQMPVKNDTDFVFRFLLAGGTYSVVERRLVEQVKHDGPQLTNGNARRLKGTLTYMAKHKEHLRLRDRRHLKLTIRRMQYHAAKNPIVRAWYLTLALSNYSPAKYVEEREIRRAWIELEKSSSE